MTVIEDMWPSLHQGSHSAGFKAIDHLPDSVQESLDANLLTATVRRLEDIGFIAFEIMRLLDCSQELIDGLVPRPYRLSADTRARCVGLMSILTMLEEQEHDISQQAYWFHTHKIGPDETPSSYMLAGGKDAINHMVTYVRHIGYERGS